MVRLMTRELGSSDDQSPSWPDINGDIIEYQNSLSTCLGQVANPAMFSQYAEQIDAMLAESDELDNEELIRRKALVNYHRGSFAYDRGLCDVAVQCWYDAHEVFHELAAEAVPEIDSGFDLYYAFRLSKNLAIICYDKDQFGQALRFFSDALSHAAGVFSPTVGLDTRKEVHEDVDEIIVPAMFCTDIKQDVAARSNITRFCLDYEFGLKIPPDWTVQARKQWLSSKVRELMSCGETIAIETRRIPFFLEELDQYDDQLESPSPDATDELVFEHSNINLLSAKLAEGLEDYAKAGEHYHLAYSYFVQLGYSAAAAICKFNQAKQLMRDSYQLEDADALMQEAFDCFLVYCAKGLADPKRLAILPEMAEVYKTILTGLDKLQGLSALEAAFNAHEVSLCVEPEDKDYGIEIDLGLPLDWRYTRN